MLLRTMCLAAALAAPLLCNAQVADTAPAGYSPADCPPCAGWNTPHPPVRLHGDTYHVGTAGLGAVLLASDSGHVLIDAGLPESAPHIVANIRALGFRVEDVRLIVTSHAHYDHAGGVAALQRASGARVAASPRSAPVLQRGTPGPDDPQYTIALAFPAVGDVDVDVDVIGDGDTLRVGPIALVAHFTPGHTPGGTSWTWESCGDGTCLAFVYADSQTPVAADDFRFTRTTTYPEVLDDFARSFAVLESLRCDVLLTPHPGASRLWERVAARDAGRADALVDPAACRRYAATARESLARRVAREKSGR